MRLDRRLAEEEPFPDLPVGQPFADEREHFNLARREVARKSGGRARRLLRQWRVAAERFVVVMPREFKAARTRREVANGVIDRRRVELAQGCKKFVPALRVLDCAPPAKRHETLAVLDRHQKGGQR